MPNNQQIVSVMRLLFIFFLTFYTLQPLLAQNSNNYFQVLTNTGLNFNLDEPNDIENGKTLTNALTLRLKTKNQNCSVYARLYNYSAPAGFYPSSSPLYLDWTSDNSNNAGNLVTTSNSIESYDKLLFTQPKSATVFSYYYNLYLSAVGYDYPPGNYNFTLLFTMTQP